jgi:lysozyme
MAFREVGIDVSRFQDDANGIDWKAVKNDDDNIEFVFIKASQGIAYSKTKFFYDNVPKIRAVGLHCGPYHYGTFPNVPEAIAQAKFCESVILPVKDKLDFPIVLDLEENKAKVSRKQLTDAAIAFMDYFKNKGYQVMLYTGDAFLDSSLDEERLKAAGYLFWIARYGADPKNEHAIHQYTDKGKVDGINGAVDMNEAFLDFAAKPDKQYKVTIDNVKFYQAKALVAEYEKKGYKCQGSSRDVLKPNEKPNDSTPYIFTVFCTHSQAVKLVIELKIKGYSHAVGAEIK